MARIKPNPPPVCCRRIFLLQALLLFGLQNRFHCFCSGFNVSPRRFIVSCGKLKAAGFAIKCLTHSLKKFKCSVSRAEARGPLNLSIVLLTAYKNGRWIFVLRLFIALRTFPMVNALLLTYVCTLVLNRLHYSIRNWRFPIFSEYICPHAKPVVRLLMQVNEQISIWFISSC